MTDQEAEVIVLNVMEREYLRDPHDPDEGEPPGKRVYVDGRFTSEEFEAMALCMKNNKWPDRGREW